MDFSETSAFAKYSRAAVVKVFEAGTVTQNTGSEHLSCEHYRLRNSLTKRRVSVLVIDSRMIREKQIEAVPNQRWS